MNTHITVTVPQIIARLGGTAAVARLCKVSPPAVSQWKSANHIPDAREQLLRVLRPDAFRARKH